MELCLRNFTYFKLGSKKMFTGKKPVKWLATRARSCKVAIIWERLAISFLTETFDFNRLHLASEISTIKWNNTASYYFRNYESHQCFSPNSFHSAFWAHSRIVCPGSLRARWGPIDYHVMNCEWKWAYVTFRQKHLTADVCYPVLSFYLEWPPVTFKKGEWRKEEEKGVTRKERRKGGR